MQSLQQKQALAAVTHRRLRGLPPPAPTRNGAFATVPPPAAKPAEGAGSSSPSSSAVPFFAYIIAFLFSGAVWAVVGYGLTVNLGWGR